MSAGDGSATATVGETLEAAIRRLRPRRGDEARYDATLLLVAATARDAAWLLAHAGDPLAASSATRFGTFVERRERGEPVAYILGTAGFYGRSFRVNANVLVPRPETEGLVVAALAELRAFGDETARICDVGTGSGVIAITLACERPAAALTAIDVSLAALATAFENATAHRVADRVTFVAGRGLATLDEGERFACIVANLPYVKTADLAPAPDPTSFEPRIALDGGSDGLALYRPLLRAAAGRLEPGGSLVMEAGPDTVPRLAAEARAAFARDASLTVVRDLAGLERLVIIRTARP